MNKTPRLSKSGIEYLDYMWGIWSGCRNQQSGICPVKRCWAKGIALHFPKLYPNGFEPTFYIEAIDSPKHLKKPSRIGVGWVGDVIGYCDHVSERSLIFQTILQCPQHTFLFLTKNPEKLASWGQFPDNCWVGVTATNRRMFIESLRGLKDVRAMVRYISIEPYLERIISDEGWHVEGAEHIKFGDGSLMRMCGIGWVIIGQQTPISAKTQPKIEWIQEILELADKADNAKIPVFLKDNLYKLLCDLPNDAKVWSNPRWKLLRQEFPNEK